jgi:hypothetical protein
MVENMISLLLAALALALWFHGYRRTGSVGVLAAALFFCAAGLAIWSRWHARQHGQPLVVAEFFLFLAAVGSLQFGIGAQGMADGYIRPTVLDGIAPDSLYNLLIAPTGEPIYRSEQPVGFLWEVAFRVIVGSVLAFFLPILAGIWRMQNGG